MKSDPCHLIPPAVLERFRHLKASNRLAHAYLFTGPRGIGKAAIAFAVARLINCEKESSDIMTCDCPSCVKINSGNHPDIVVVERSEDKTVIAVDQMRELMTRFELKPLLARVKVAVIRDADQLSLDAANIFLKTLEEPPADTLLILTTRTPDRMLRTIRSRCHELRFFSCGNSTLAKYLENEYDVDSVAAQILARFAQGSPANAHELGKEFLERKNAFLDEFIFGRSDDAVIKRVGADKDLAREFLLVVLAFYRDILVIKNGAGEGRVFHRDRLTDLKRVEPRYGVEDIERIMAQTIKAIDALSANFNVKIALTLLKEMI